jgi:hypothetical protein
VANYRPPSAALSRRTTFLAMLFTANCKALVSSILIKLSNKNLISLKAIANEARYILCEPSIFEKVFIWFLGQPVVWSEPNMSLIEAWSLSIYAWYQEFDFDFFSNFFIEFQTKKLKKKFFKNFKNK